MELCNVVESNSRRAVWPADPARVLGIAKGRGKAPEVPGAAVPLGRGHVPPVVLWLDDVKGPEKRIAVVQAQLAPGRGHTALSCKGFWHVRKKDKVVLKVRDKHKNCGVRELTPRLV